MPLRIRKMRVSTRISLAHAREHRGTPHRALERLEGEADMIPTGIRSPNGKPQHGSNPSPSVVSAIVLKTMILRASITRSSNPTRSRGRVLSGTVLFFMRLRSPIVRVHSSHRCPILLSLRLSMLGSAHTISVATQHGRTTAMIALVKRQHRGKAASAYIMSLLRQ